MPYVLPDGRRISVDVPFVLDEVQYPPNWLRHASADDKAAIGVTWEADPVETPPAPTKAQLATAAAAKRWRVETGGITLNGVQIRTDEISQTKILGARVAAKEDANYALTWKASDGTFVPLTASQIIAIADAVRAHVQACFDAEAAVAAKINNNTYTTMAAIEAASEWPSN